MIVLLVLIITIIVIANSSWVIKKVADKFAPDYKISYDTITGNIFTGVKINNLKFEDKVLSKKITFSWNPSKILYKTVVINELSIEALDVDVVKALIASFPTNDTNNTSNEPFSLVVLVDNVDISLNPFEEQGVYLSKTSLNVENIYYSSDTIGIEYLRLNIDTNITKISLEASLDNAKLEIHTLLLDDVDTVALEKIILTKENNSTKEKKKKITTHEKEETFNPLIPKEVQLDNFLLSIKPRDYQSVHIKEVKVNVNTLLLNVEKITSNDMNSINIDSFSLFLDSNVTHLTLLGNLKAETLTFENINIEALNTGAVQSLFMTETNTTTIKNKNKNQDEEEINHLIPKYILINSFKTEILPTSYAPVTIKSLLLYAKDMTFNTQEGMIENGSIDINGTTNLSNISYDGTIKDNQILGSVVVHPHDTLFTLYTLPLRREAIGDIVIDINATKEEVALDIKAKAKQILIVETAEANNSDDNTSKAFNFDIDSLLSHVVYTVADNSLVADSKVMLSTPYAKDVSLTNTFLMDKNMSYFGEIKAKKIIGIDKKFLKPLHHLKVNYNGDLSSIKTNISSDGLKGTFVSSDFKKGIFHLETTKAIELDKMLVLPAELNTTKVNVMVDVPLDFAKITHMTVKVKIHSNISNIDANISYDKALKVKIISTITKDSLLQNFDKNVKWNAISPLLIEADLGEKEAMLILKSKALSSTVHYTLENGYVDGKIALAGLHADIKGLAQEKISLNANVNSIESLIKSIKYVYTIEDVPPVEGALNVSVDILKLNQVNLSLSSPKIIYHADRETEHLINDVKLVISADKSKVQLKSYAVTYNEMKIFSTKPSLIKMQENNIEISELWLNDQLKVVGNYNLETAKGDISADAQTFHLAHKLIDLDTAIHINTLLDTGKTSLKGKVVLLGGDIHYDLSSKTYPSDNDIIIVQDKKKEESSPFMENLSMLINVTTKKPLKYKKGPINIQASVNLDIHKLEYSQPMILGEVKIHKGGSYTFEDKKFVLDRSKIYFTGNPNKPILDIRIKYKSLNYMITITVSGTPATPNIMFSSVPSLSREEILSVILFDSEGGAGTNSADDMMKMMGGAMAKSALSDMGIKLDHLLIGSDGSVEIGKKLTDKIMFIYLNDVIPKVSVKYQHTSRWESVISADEESESYDIVYKRDYSTDDITIFGR